MDPEPLCPFFKKLKGSSHYPLIGYCCACPTGTLKVPTIAEFRDLCTTERYLQCQAYLSQLREEQNEAA